MKRGLSVMTFMLFIATLLLSVNLSTVSGASVGMRVVPQAAPCIGLHINDPSTPGYSDNVVTFNADGSMSFDFSKGLNGNSYGFQPNSRYEWNELFYIENLKDTPLKYKIENVGLQYISVEESLTNLSFVSNAVNNDANWGTIAVGQTTPIRIYFEVPSNTPLGVINGTLNIITDCQGPSNDDGGESNGGDSAPAITLEKTANVSLAKPGESVTYTYTVRNTGNQTLYNVVLQDSLLGEIPLNKTTLAPGEEAIGTITYTVEEEDFPGPLVNKATVIGNTDNGKVESSAEASIVLRKDTVPPKDPGPSRGDNLSTDSDTKHLPNTGGTPTLYIAGGFILAGIGILLKRKS